MKFEDIVLSSFVYSGSSRKLAILAAANNPINTELVTQLVGYLDEEYLKPKEEAAPIKPAESRAKHAADKPDSKSPYDEVPLAVTDAKKTNLVDLRFLSETILEV